MNPVIKFEQMGFMGAWRNEFMCFEMDVAARFNICIQDNVGPVMPSLDGKVRHDVMRSEIY